MIGLSALGVKDAAVQELAADLATSIAASGREVLLVDTIFDSPSHLPEYGSTGATLADMVASTATSEDLREELKLALDDRDRVMSELLSVRAGQPDADPVDAVAGRRFRELLDVAAELVEAVILAAPQWGHPETDVLAQRLDHIVLVGRVGVTTAIDIEDAADSVSTSRERPIGLVLLRSRRSFGVGSRIGGSHRSGPKYKRPPKRSSRPRPLSHSSPLPPLYTITGDDAPVSDAADLESSAVVTPPADVPNDGDATEPVTDA
jgi:Mrp family chromosome partitioning ATPase